jgi:hypothetical protein
MPSGVDNEVERELGTFLGRGGGLKMRQCRSLGSGTGDFETVPSEPEGLLGALRRRLQHQCALSEYVERHRILTTRKGWL